MQGQTVAIIGASPDQSKFGNKAVRAFLKKGWTVFPIHPKAAEVEGQKAYAAVADLPDTPDQVLLYVDPRIGTNILEEIKNAGINEVFVNPGADSPELFSRAEELGLGATFGCAIMAIGENPSFLLNIPGTPP